jgi:hypothetical protein
MSGPRRSAPGSGAGGRGQAGGSRSTGAGGPAGPSQGRGEEPQPLPPLRPAPRPRDPEDAPRRGMERIGDLLPRAAREFGLEEQLAQAEAAAAWDRVVAARVSAAAGSCRLASLDRGVATIEVDLPIVGQEIRLRSRELLAALRSQVGPGVVSLQVTVRHV